MIFYKDITLEKVNFTEGYEKNSMSESVKQNRPCELAWSLIYMLYQKDTMCLARE